MVTWIAALQHGATEAALALLYDAVTPIITKLMGYAQLVDQFDLTQEEVAARVGKNRATVAHAPQ